MSSARPMIARRLDPGRRLELVERHHRAGPDLDDLAAHAVILEHGFEHAGRSLRAPPRRSRRPWRPAASPAVRATAAPALRRGPDRAWAGAPARRACRAPPALRGGDTSRTRPRGRGPGAGTALAAAAAALRSSRGSRRSGSRRDRPRAAAVRPRSAACRHRPARACHQRRIEPAAEPRRGHRPAPRKQRQATGAAPRAAAEIAPVAPGKPEDQQQQQAERRPPPSSRSASATGPSPASASSRCSSQPTAPPQPACAEIAPWSRTDSASAASTSAAGSSPSLSHKDRSGPVQHQAQRPAEQHERDHKGGEPQALAQDVGEHRAVAAEEIVRRGIDRRVERRVLRVDRKTSAAATSSAASSRPKPKVSKTRRFNAANGCVQTRRRRASAPAENPTDLAMLPPMPACAPNPMRLSHPHGAPSGDYAAIASPRGKARPLGRLDSPPAPPHVLAMSDDAELLIAGGGLNGLLLGIACAGAGLAVALVDREDPAAMLDQGFDGRSSAIAYGSQQVLAALGLWPLIAARGRADPGDPGRRRQRDAVSALRSSRIGPGPGAGRRAARLDHREPGAAPRADRAGAIAADPGLPRPARGRCGCDFGHRRRGCALRWPAADAPAWSPPPTAPASPLRRAAGIRTLEWRYPQTAIVTTVQHARPHAGIAVEHFLPAGPFAILPMTGNRSSIVWTEREELAPRLLALADAEFAAELAARFGDFLGAVEPVGPALVIPGRADAGRALCRPAAGADRRGGACDPPDRRPGAQPRHPRRGRPRRDRHRHRAGSGSTSATTRRCAATSSGAGSTPCCSPR